MCLGSMHFRAPCAALKQKNYPCVQGQTVPGSCALSFALRLRDIVCTGSRRKDVGNDSIPTLCGL